MTPQPTRAPRRRPRRTVTIGGALAAVTVLLVALAACGGASDDSGSVSASDSGVASGGSAAQEPALDAAPGDAVGGQTSGSRQPAAELVEPQRAVISTGEVHLTSKDVADVRSRVDGVLRRAGGFVADERTETDDDGRTTSSSLTLRVPAAKFDAVMKDLAGLGRLVSTDRSAEDVTTQVIDVKQRIRAQEVGLRRLERLMSEAGSLADLLSVEREVTNRQAALDSLKQQQKYLDEQTSLATITLGVSRRTAPAPVEHTGFLGGLQNGWDALVGVYRALAVSLGALLPFAVVALVLFFPGRLLVRRVRRPKAAVAA